MRNWGEEIFADVFAGRIYGPIVALDFQDLMLRRPKRFFLHDDRQHPTPVPRLEVHLSTLEYNGHNAWTVSLRQRWQAQRDLIVDSATLDSAIVSYSGSNPVLFKNALAPLAVATQVTNKLLPDDIKFNPSLVNLQFQAGPPSNDDPSLGDNLNDLYQSWDGIVDEARKDAAPGESLCDIAWEVADWDTCLKRVTDEDEDVWGIFGRSRGEREWLASYYTEGWKVEGPSGSPPQ